MGARSLRSSVAVGLIGLSVTVASMLTGCARQDPAAVLLQDYEDRIARVTGVTEVAVDEPVLAAWPRSRDRLIEVPPQRVGLGRFLSLHRCGDLGTLIGERSSQLGRVMTASQRLSYEHRFLVAAERCLQRLQGDPDRETLHAELAAITAEKRRWLGARAWNATLGSDLLAAAHGRDATPLRPREAELAGQAEAAALQQWSIRLRHLGDPELDIEGWEAPFETLARSQLPGRLRVSAALLTRHLNGVAARLEQRQQERPLCPQGTATRDADILWNIFRGYHGEEVQPYLVAIDRARRDWLAAMDDLLAAQTISPPEDFVAAALAPDAGIWPDLDAARRRHVAAWAVILEQCRLLPG